jgi:hypothetical protein
MSYLPLFLFVCIELFVGAPMSYLPLFLFVCIKLFVGTPMSYLPLFLFVCIKQTTLYKQTEITVNKT